MISFISGTKNKVFQRDLLWAGFGEELKNHLVKLDNSCHLKREGLGYKEV
jgi:hypothetical protein